MRVQAVSQGSVVASTDDIEVVTKNLEALAKQHNSTVDELLKSAHSAGVDGPMYLVRALNLEARLNRLRGEQ